MRYICTAYLFVDHRPYQGTPFSALFYSLWWHTLRLARVLSGHVAPSTLRCSLLRRKVSFILCSANIQMVRFLTRGAYPHDHRTLRRTHSSHCHRAQAQLRGHPPSLHRGDSRIAMSAGAMRTEAVTTGRCSQIRQPCISETAKAYLSLTPEIVCFS
jgi:hypothetical protein